MGQDTKTKPVVDTKQTSGATGGGADMQETVKQGATVDAPGKQGEPLTDDEILSTYGDDDYYADLEVVNNLLYNSHKTAIDNFESTIKDEETERGNVLGAVVAKGLTDAIGMVPVIGSTAKVIIDYGTTAYEEAKKGGDDKTASALARDLRSTLLATYQKNSITNMERKSGFIKTVKGLKGEELKKFVLNMQKGMIESKKDAQTRINDKIIEKALLEGHINSIDKEGGWFSFGKKGRIVISYYYHDYGYGGYGSGIKFSYWGVQDSENDAAIKKELLRISNGSVDIGSLNTQKDIILQTKEFDMDGKRAPKTSTNRMIFGKSNNIEKDDPKVNKEIWQTILGSKMPTFTS